MKLSTCVFALLISLWQGSPVLAQPLAERHSKAVLTVTGDIGKPHGTKVAQFDMDMLSTLPQRTIRTSTPWFPGVSEFTGPLLTDVLALVEPRGNMIKATALNDYSITLPLSDAINHEVVLAVRLNGQLMSIREKGPVFMIYPFDSKKELRSQVYYERSVWQLKSLELQ